MMQRNSLILAIDTCVDTCSVSISKYGPGMRYRSNKTANLNDIEFNVNLIELQPHRQAETLLNLINKALCESHCDYADITHIAITIGPGSFSGVRIGMAAVQGICCAMKIKHKRAGMIQTRKKENAQQNLTPPTKCIDDVQIIPITTMEVIANGYIRQNQRCSSDLIINALLPAGKQELYSQQFLYNAVNTPLTSLDEISILSESAIEKRLNTADLSNSQIFCGVLDARSSIKLCQCDNFFTIYPNARNLTYAAASNLALLKNICDAESYDFEPLYIRKPDAVIHKSTNIKK